MMSYSYSLTEKYEASFLERLFLKLIKQGPIPKHCAFILDGNRRFAKKFLSGNLLAGYEMGYCVILRAIHMVLDCGITEMTVYLFSEDNYKRPKNDVEAVMLVMFKGLQQLEKEIDYINEHGICIEAIGKWEQIPNPEIVRVLARLMIKTKGNDKSKINMAIGYSGRQEIVACADAVITGLGDGLILPDDLNDDLLLNILTLGGTKPVDLLIRTSGVTRLSDFLLWNTNDNTWLKFIDVSWPEFKLGHFLTALCAYQKRKPTLKAKRENAGLYLQSKRAIDFVEQFRATKWDHVTALSTEEMITSGF